MARSGGFEPPTAWFVARYSIQLSYERVVFNIRVTDIRAVPCGLRRDVDPLLNLYNNNGALRRIRTSDRLVRSQVLYPAEL